MRLLVVAFAVAAIAWYLFGSGLGCETIAYPVRCRGAVVGNRCHGDLVEALPQRRFVVDPAAQRVVEIGVHDGSHPRCRVQACGQWECIDEVFVRSASDREFRQQLRPGLTPVDPRWTLSEVYVPAWLWWKVRVQTLAEGALAEIVDRRS
ncbi:MAG TPA: hypothetical protein VLF14_11385 [Candidatus Binatia bacterium]|nr:hypothetical protein [Candidatus Binatia bacterium]